MSTNNKKAVFSNSFVKIARVNSPKGDYLELIWLPETANMDDEEWKTCVRAYADAIPKEKLAGFYVDNTSFLYPIDIDLQDWLNEEIYPKNKKDGLRKTALRVSADFISQLSVDQTVNEVPDPSFQFKFFANDAEAIAWLQA